MSQLVPISARENCRGFEISGLVGNRRVHDGETWGEWEGEKVFLEVEWLEVGVAKVLET
jgi:hypothetical protein